MLELSKNFKNDIISTNQTLKPIILITQKSFETGSDAEISIQIQELFAGQLNTVVTTLTLDNDVVHFYQYGVTSTKLRTIPAISKISNVKISTDYDSKTLKINRLRCTLYNYYDVNTKLSEHINTNVVGKELWLFYKSPSTNTVNPFPDYNQPSADKECSLIYRGEISRITYNDKTIDLTVEDKTQIKIADKQVPYMSVDKLEQSIRENILKEYQDDDIVVPMTFGQVDKAPVLPYLDTGTDRILNILLDVQPTYGNHRTGKIPSGMINSCLYIKKDSEYIILDHQDISTINQQRLNSKIMIYSFSTGTANYLMPELQESVEGETFKIWSGRGYFHRLVENVYASDGSILDITNIEEEELTNLEFENISALNDNGGFERKWYRLDDPIVSGAVNFDTGLKDYPLGTEGGAGRWILLKLEKGIDNDLLGLGEEYESYNTLVFADYNIYQSLDGSTPNDDTLHTDPGAQGGEGQTWIDRTGFFVTPIAIDVWRNLLTDASDYVGQQANLNRLLLRNDEDIQLAQESNAESGYLQDAYAERINAIESAKTPIYLRRQYSEAGGPRFWGDKSNGSFPYVGGAGSSCQGLYYGDRGEPGRRISGTSDEHDIIGIYEFFPPYWTNEYPSSFQQGLRMNNVGVRHSVLIEDLQEEEIFASITGRKNAYFTEQLEYVDYESQEITLSDIILGPDGQSPADYILTWGPFDVSEAPLPWPSYIATERMHNMWDEIMLGADVSGSSFAQITEDPTPGFGYRFTELLYLDGTTAENVFFSEIGIDVSIDDSATGLVYSFIKDYVWRVQTAPLRFYDVINVNTSTELEDASSNYWYPNYQSLTRRWNNNTWPNKFVPYFAAKIYEYIYQQDIVLYDWFFEDTESPFSFNYYPNGGGSTGSYVTLDITDSFNAKMVGNNWNDYTIDTFDDWIENFYVYYDNLIYAVCKSMAEAIVPVGNSVNLEICTNYDNYIEDHPTLGGISYLEGSTLNIEEMRNELLEYATQQIQGADLPGQTTDGIIKKPSDIVMNILTNEMEYGKLIEDQSAGQDIVAPDYDKFDMDSIIESREAHNWQMGFSVGKKTEGKLLIESILKESKSYPRFTSDGRFGLMTIKESYVYGDIDSTINVNDILSYKFKQTKREDITTSVKMFYRYDYGQEKYNNFLEKSIDDIFPDWALTGYDNYNMSAIDGFKEIKLKHHTETGTVNEFANYTLMNNCNPHNMVDLKLPMNMMDLEVGDKIHIPLINNEKIFNIDYSVVDFVNGQPVYPLWIIMETNIGVDSITIKAYQLHYLGTDGNHGFDIPNQTYQVIGNWKEYNTTYPTIKNWNFNPLATVHNNYEIPYGDMNANGFINVVDITALVNHITGGVQLTSAQIERINGLQQNNDGVVNILDIVELINIVIG